MIEKEESTKKAKAQKRNLIIIISILSVLFIGYALTIRSTPKSREKKIISFLENKYDSEFEIIKMTSSGEHILINEIICDGSTCIPEVKDKGVYYYKYSVKSLSDNVVFEVEYLDRRFFDKISETISYYSLVHTDDILNDINNYIIETFGDKTVKVSSSSISVEFSEKFDKICDSEYKEKLKRTDEYIGKKLALDSNLNILVYFNYSDDILITFGYAKPVVTKRSDEDFEGAEGIDIVTGKYIKTYYGLEEYFEREK